MTGEEMRGALVELGWKQADLCRRIEMNKNTVSAWANSAPPAWVSEYLGAMLAIDRLHRAFVRPAKPTASPANANPAPLRGRAAALAKQIKTAPDLFAGNND